MMHAYYVVTYAAAWAIIARAAWDLVVFLVWLIAGRP